MGDPMGVAAAERCARLGRLSPRGRESGGRSEGLLDTTRLSCDVAAWLLVVRRDTRASRGGSRRG
jgi:hypothetical protein